MLSPGNDHVRLQHDPFESYSGFMKFKKNPMQNAFGDGIAMGEIVVPIHEHFRLNDRHQAGGLAMRRVTGQRLRISGDRVIAWAMGV